MHIYCILYWKLKTEWWLHAWIVSSWDHVVDGSCGSLLLLSIASIRLHITSLGKGQIKTWKCGLHWMPTTLNNGKMKSQAIISHHKLGTVVINTVVHT